MGKAHAATHAAIMLETSNRKAGVSQLKDQLSAPATDLAEVTFYEENKDWIVWWN